MPNTENTGVVAAEPPAGIARPVRIFVGLRIAPEIARELARLAAGLKPFPVRLVAAADIHLTLVPPWEEIAVADAIGKLRLVASGFRTFSLTFQHVGYGPHVKRPRLLWAECTASGEIAALRAILLQAFGQLDERPFLPHVTLARIRGTGFAVARACPIDQTLSFTQRVESVELFQSPARGESGYRILASVRLGETSQLVAEPQVT